MERKIRPFSKFIPILSSVVLSWVFFEVVCSKLGHWKLVSRSLLNPYGGIGSGYPTMPMIVIGSSFRYYSKTKMVLSGV